jgi:hypothetical protein
MKDKIEKFVEENRPSFNDLSPNSELFSRIQSRINDQEKGIKVVSIWKWMSLAAAACFVGVVFSMFYLKTENVTNEDIIVDSGTEAGIIDTSTENDLINLDTNDQSQEPQVQLVDGEGLKVNKVDNSKSSISARGAKAVSSNQLRTPVSHESKDKAIAKLGENNKLKKQSFFNAIYNMESASTRLNAATVGSSGDQMDKDIIDALFNSMNNDPNTNVRMAALESLAYFGYEKNVKKKLIEGLKLQNDPVVKVALIQYLTAIRATSIRPDLQKMAGDEATPKYLRDQAYNSLMRMELL